MMQEKKLFSDFASVSKAQWKEKIIGDLKGADFDKKLVWHTDSGFDVQPIYTREDLEGLIHLNQLPLKSKGVASDSNAWRINELFFVSDTNKTSQMVRQVLKNGADSLAFVFTEQPQISRLKTILEDVDVQNTELNFKVPDPVDLLQQLSQLADEWDWKKSALKGSVYCDPLAEKEPDFSKAKTIFESVQNFPNFHCFTLDVSGFHNRGGSTVTELALALAYGTETLQQLGELGMEPNDVAPRIRFNFAVGSQYFIELSKFRAFRYIWDQVLQAYGVTATSTYIHGTNAMINKTIYDPYVNMLRTTTETMSAVLGGVDAFTVMPFDAIYEIPTRQAIRTARNQQNILKEESFFHKVSDPAAGSYYIENLTDQLISESWNLFLEIDDKGGYSEALEQGFISERIRKEAAGKLEKVNQKRKSVLGVNLYPNLNETKESGWPEALFFSPETPHDFDRPFRMAAAVEQLRYQTDSYAEKNKRPVVWLFTYGDLTLRRARAQFASGFFGCAGYEVIDHPGFEHLEAGVRKVKDDQPDIVVLCASDEDYKTFAIPAYHALKNEATVVMAGYPTDQIESLKAAGFEHFIHVRSNLLAELKKYQEILGI